LTWQFRNIQKISGKLLLMFRPMRGGVNEISDCGQKFSGTGILLGRFLFESSRPMFVHQIDARPVSNTFLLFTATP
jgi:hypothetical protein